MLRGTCCDLQSEVPSDLQGSGMLWSAEEDTGVLRAGDSLLQVLQHHPAVCASGAHLAGRSPWFGWVSYLWRCVLCHAARLLCTLACVASVRCLSVD